MKPLYRHLFLLFGICALGVMVVQMPEGWESIAEHPERIASYAPLIVGIWLPIYALNAWAFQLMVHTSDHRLRLPFRHALKLTISGFAFSYTTPFGSGGAPYRVMELSRFIGMPRAISSVTLYSMMHVFSHFFLWTTALVVFLIVRHSLLTTTLWALALGYLLVFVLALFFFRAAYRRGIMARLFALLFFLPGIGKWARRFYENRRSSFDTIDHNIRLLYQHPRQFWGSLTMEYAGRLLNAFEFYFILLAFGLTDATWSDALIILGFSSFVGNLLFFLPMQIGAREGSLAIVVPLLFRMASGSLGLYVSFFTRIREIFWIALGLLLVKVGNQRLMR